MVMNLETVNPYQFKTMLGDVKTQVSQGQFVDAERQMYTLSLIHI